MSHRAVVASIFPFAVSAASAGHMIRVLLACSGFGGRNLSRVMGGLGCVPGAWHMSDAHCPLHCFGGRQHGRQARGAWHGGLMTAARNREIDCVLV
jgi:hypothetical protein